MLIIIRKIKAIPGYIRRSIRRFILSVKLFRNWWVYLADHVGLILGERAKLKLRNGLVIEIRPATYDSLIVFETFTQQEYVNNVPFLPKSYKNIIDLGGQIGVFSLFAAKHFRESRIVTVEATKSNFEQLQRNIVINNLDSRIMPINQAIWGETGEMITLALHDSNSGGHSAVGLANSFSKTEKVSTISLKDLMITHNISSCDLLKCDIEGAEYEVFFKTTDEVLRRIRSISLEVHYLDNQRNGSTLANFLRRKGFEITRNGSRYIFATRIDHK